MPVNGIDIREFSAAEYRQLKEVYARQICETMRVPKEMSAEELKAAADGAITDSVAERLARIAPDQKRAEQAAHAVRKQAVLMRSDSRASVGEVLAEMMIALAVFVTLLFMVGAISAH